MKLRYNNGFFIVYCKMENTVRKSRENIQSHQQSNERQLKNTAILVFMQSGFSSVPFSLLLFIGGLGAWEPHFPELLASVALD